MPNKNGFSWYGGFAFATPEPIYPQNIIATTQNQGKKEHFETKNAKSFN